MDALDKRVQLVRIHHLTGGIQRARVVVVDPAERLLRHPPGRPLSCQQRLKFDIIPVIQLFAEPRQGRVGSADLLRQILTGRGNRPLRMGNDKSRDFLFAFAQPEAEKLQPVLKAQFRHGFLLK